MAPSGRGSLLPTWSNDPQICGCAPGSPGRAVAEPARSRTDARPRLSTSPKHHLDSSTEKERLRCQPCKIAPPGRSHRGCSCRTACTATSDVASSPRTPITCSSVTCRGRCSRSSRPCRRVGAARHRGRPHPHGNAHRRPGSRDRRAGRPAVRVVPEVRQGEGGDRPPRPHGLRRRLRRGLPPPLRRRQIASPDRRRSPR
jgi:hypothetical protein